jgi:hypothetical protein
VVVLADEDGRDVPQLRKVQRLVEGADVRCPVAEERDGDARLVAKLEGERRADDGGQTAADDRVCAQVPTLDVVEVHRASVPVRTALELPVQLRHELVRVRSLREGMTVGPVRGGDHVSLLERAADTDSDGLLPDRDVEEAWQLAGPEALLDLLLEASNEQHLAEELPQKLGRDDPFSLHLGHVRQSRLGRVRIAEQFRELESRLPADWADVRLVLNVEDAGRAERAASLLTPFAPGRVGGQVRFSVSRRGGRLDQTRRLLERIDREGITGSLELVTSSLDVPEVAAESRATWPPAAEQWDAAVAALPEDWTDVYAQVELASSDFLDRGALLMGPVNPARYGDSAGFRFRVGTYGYGAAPEMARRCLERLDEAGIDARVEILHALSDTKPVLTQGPVWYLEGKAV